MQPFGQASRRRNSNGHQRPANDRHPTRWFPPSISQRIYNIRKSEAGTLEYSGVSERLSSYAEPSATGCVRIPEIWTAHGCRCPGHRANSSILSPERTSAAYTPKSTRFNGNPQTPTKQSGIQTYLLLHP